MGPILNEFKLHRKKLIEQTYVILKDSLLKQNRIVPKESLEVKFTAQGGVGTAEEHEFLLKYYELDSVGWGSPFLLVPEVTTVDKETRELLVKAKEDDLCLSKISPLGVPFNSLRTNTKDAAKHKLIEQGKPGSSCPKKYLVSNTEFSDEPICTASKKYQEIKLNELKHQNFSGEKYEKQYNKIVNKSCLCVGLASSALLLNNLKPDSKEEGVSICPGPNLAYFSNTFSMKDMIDHIYGRINIMFRKDRPNLFVKELKIYIDYLKDKISEVENPFSNKDMDYFLKFTNNLEDGINYYKSLFSNIKSAFNDIKFNVLSELDTLEMELKKINFELIPIDKNYQSKTYGRVINS